MLFNLLCLSTSYADCIAETGQSCRQSASLPQHVLRGLHPLNRREYQAFRLFASARPTRIASFDSWIAVIRPLLCLSTSYADCIPHASATPAGAPTLPQHVLRGLHRGSGISALQMLIFASARPTRIASAKTHKVRLAFMTDGAVSR